MSEYKLYVNIGIAKDNAEKKLDIDQDSYINMLRNNSFFDSPDISGIINDEQHIADNYEKILCKATDGIDDSEITKEKLNSIIQTKSLSSLIIRLNDNFENEDVLFELISWINDSMIINNDTRFGHDANEKLVELPLKTFLIEIDGTQYVLNDCKVIEKYNNEPLSFRMIINKIELK